MRTDFFETQVKEMQRMFNRAYRDRIVFDIRTRTGCMFGIIRMSLLKNDIQAARTEDERRESIAQFVEARNVIRDVLGQVMEVPISPAPRKAKDAAELAA